METIPIRSSMLKAASYDPDAQELVVTFVNGSRYAYAGVPQDEVDALAGADSQGKQFASAIRDSYEARRL